jgi:hypothetical protein
LACGQTTKEIAYSLGIEDSTARVLLARSAAKLGVAGRTGLLAHPAINADGLRAQQAEGAVASSLLKDRGHLRVGSAPPFYADEDHPSIGR